MRLLSADLCAIGKASIDSYPLATVCGKRGLSPRSEFLLSSFASDPKTMFEAGWISMVVIVVVCDFNVFENSDRIVGQYGTRGVQ